MGGQVIPINGPPNLLVTMPNIPANQINKERWLHRNVQRRLAGGPVNIGGRGEHVHMVGMALELAATLSQVFGLLDRSGDGCMGLTVEDVV